MTIVLVVGGAGYIGSHTCKALKAAGMKPVVYDNFKGGHLWAVKWGPCVVGDLFDEESLDQTFKTYQPDVVLHFASSINVRESMQNPSLYYYNNVVGSLKLLDAMQKNNRPLLVFSSSAAVYGMPEKECLVEESACHPTHVYGRSKWMVEEMIHDYERAHGLRSVIFRYFNAAGADLEGELGEAHNPETHLIPLAIRTALGHQESLNVFGSDHATLDGTAIRDYVHVTDLAEAHVLAVQWLLSGKESAVLNLAAGRGYSVSEVLAMVERVTQRSVKKSVLPKNAGEPAILVANAQKAASILGWKAKKSDLETIVSTAYHWHLK